MKILEIFNSIDGEGNRAGQLATFIRLAGCNLRCPYCDTKYSWTDQGEAEELSVSQVIERVNSTGYRNVTVTGGEPLIHSGIQRLLSDLLLTGHNINVETNGSIDVKLVRALTETTPNLYFTIDYKCPSSGQEREMFQDNFLAKNLTDSDVIKFVVGDVIDLEVARMITNKGLKDFKGAIYVSPVFEAIEPAQIVEFMKRYKMERWRMQIQMHKVIWDPNERGV